MSTPADIVKPVETIKKSVSTKMSMMYINGMSVSIMCDVNEMDVQRRKGWIERRIRESNDFSPENIVDSIKMSSFWLNYITLGTKYPNVIDNETYRKWSKDRVMFDPIDNPNPKKRHTDSQNRNDKHINRNKRGN